MRENRILSLAKKACFFFRRVFLSLILCPAASRKNIPPYGAEVKRILAIRIDRIGDIMVSLPALKALKGMFPGAKISLLVAEGKAELLKDMPWVDEVMIFKGLRQTIERLKVKKFDLAIDLLMDYPLKTAYIAHASKARFTMGFDIEGRGCFFNIKLKPSSLKQHMSRHIFGLARLASQGFLGKDIAQEADYCDIAPSEDRKERMRRMFKVKEAGGNDLLIGIHPGAHYPTQRWPLSRFAQLAEEIIDKYQAKVVILGSIEESAVVKKVFDASRQRSIQAAGLGLDELVAMISMLDLLICNNSGPLHIACSLGIPTVSTMGPTDPALWAPAGHKHIIVRKQLPCSPCGRSVCGLHDCMQIITVRDMMAAVDAQMERLIKK
jgi:lipopolysaccharide heptosyltransferase II